MSIKNFLLGHLQEQDESYFKHMSFALNVSYVLFICLVFLVMHAFIPCFKQPKGFDLYGLIAYIKYIQNKRGSEKVKS